MNKALKELIKSLEESNIKYQITDEKDGVIVSFYNKTLQHSILYLILIIDVDNNNKYMFSILTDGIFKVKNETELLKTLNKINWDNGSGFIDYVINNEKNFCIKVNSFDTFESIVNDIILFIQEIEESLEKNYEIIMKSNWA